MNDRFQRKDVDDVVQLQHSECSNSKHLAVGTFHRAVDPLSGFELDRLFFGGLFGRVIEQHLQEVFKIVQSESSTS